MIVDLRDTTTNDIAKKLVTLRDEGGAVALGRVLTLIVVTHAGGAEEAIDAANDASREHPCRVLVLVADPAASGARLDAQIRVGKDAGASEVVVLTMAGPIHEHADAVITPLLLPDAPIVAWWPTAMPADPATDPIGALAHRRVTDAAECADPMAALEALRTAHRSGDTDLAWTRLTRWRAVLAAALDQPPHETVAHVLLDGPLVDPSADLLAAWLAEALDAPVTRVRNAHADAVTVVRLERAGGAIELARTDGEHATLRQPGQPERRVLLPRRSLRDCLSEELRHLDDDEVYGDVLTRGLPRLGADGSSPA